MKKKRFSIIILLMAMVLVFGIVVKLKLDTSAKVLTDAEVAVLRSKYPICADDPPEISSRTLSLEECIELVDSFVYAEVVEDSHKYEKSIIWGDEAFQEKRKENGINDTYEFYEYSLIIIEDTEGVFKKGDKITITANAIFEEYYPKLQVGMQVVVPVVKDPKVEGRTHYTVDGMFYVTDEGYAISAFEENIKTVKSGMKVDMLLKQLKK